MTADALFPAPRAIPVADTIRSGLVQLDQPCWEVYYADGQLADDETHHGSHEEAEESYADLDDTEGRHPKQCTTRCWTATAACGYRYDIDTDGFTHFSSASEAIDVVASYEWRVRDGVLLCPAGECGECGR